MLYNTFKKPTKRFIELEDEQKMFADLGEDSGITPQMAQWCFGMSKMTMIYERDKQASPAYNQHTYEEFLEMLGRIAYMKFLGSELDQLELT